MVKARLIVTGNVQGVGFRVWVKLFAIRLGIKGLVRNLEDGSFECFLEGSRQAVEELVKRVSVQGVPDDPLSLHVEDIEVYWEGERGYKPSWRGYEGFEIDYGAEELRTAEKEMLENLEWGKLQFAGMNRTFKEELGGLKGEVQGMNRTVKEEFAGMNNVFRDGLGELKGEVQGVRSEIHDMHGDMNVSFEEMARRYDVISSELVRTREELTRAVNTLVELVGKFMKER